MMDIEQLKSALGDIIGNEIVWVEHSNPPTIQLERDNLISFCNQVYTNPKTYFDQLSCLTGLDTGSDKGTIEVIYTLYSIPFNQSLMLKVSLDRTNPEVESISSIWKSAEWLEREVFDMYGVNFLNHPDLRRILMPGDWDGFPLRKDYKEPDTYRGIKTKENSEN